MNEVSFTTDTIAYNATVIALRHFFCDLDCSPEYEEELVRRFDLGFDETTFDGYVAWQYFEDEGAGKVYNLVSGLRDLIIDVFTLHEPNDNNGGYTGFLNVGC